MAGLLDLKVVRWSVGYPVLTIEEVAREAGLPKGTILDIEKGRNTTPEMIERALEAAQRLADRRGSDGNRSQTPRTLRS